MNTCGTCKHFGDQYETERYDPVADDYVEIKRFHICNLLSHLNDGHIAIKKLQTEAAGVVDGSGYYAAFCVSDEFGCVKWEARS